MTEKYEIEEIYFTEPEGLLRVSAKITHGPTEPGISHRLCAITSDEVTPAYENWRNERISVSRNKLGEKRRTSDRGQPISTKDVVVATELGFKYRLAIPPKSKGVSGNWEYLYYGDYNACFAQLDEIAATDAHAQMEEKICDPQSGDTWTRLNTERRSDGQFGGGGFLAPGGDNEGGLLD